MLALLGFSAGSAAASETLGAGSAPLGARGLSFVAGTGPSVASNLAAAMPLADCAAASESTPELLASTRYAGTRSSGGHGATAPQPRCPAQTACVSHLGPESP